MPADLNAEAVEERGEHGGKDNRVNDRCAALPRRTGRADFPHPALARIVSSMKHSQRPRAQGFQVSVQANPLPFGPATLTASAQVSSQADPHEVIDLPKRLTRIAQAKVVGPALQVSVQPLDQFRQGGVTLLRIDELTQRLPFPRHRLAGWLQVPVAPGSPVLVSVIPKGVAQKIQALTDLSQVQHARFLAVDLQPQPPLQFALDPAAQLWAAVAGPNHKSAGLPNNPFPCPLPRAP